MDTAATTAAVATATGNPYGLVPLWINGNIVTRSTLVILVLMSLGSWFIILTKLWDQRTLKKSGKIVEKQFWTAPSLKDGVERLKKRDDYRLHRRERHAGGLASRGSAHRSHRSARVDHDGAAARGR